jgi:SET domain-containing protein
MIIPSLYIGTSEHRGRGVFSSEALAAGIVIEIAPVIVMSSKDRQLLDQTLLHDYIFEWGDDKQRCCMALGYVPIYNHAYDSNCEYEMDFEDQLIRVKTVKQVEKDEELFINYNGDWNDNTPVWFEAR